MLLKFFFSIIFLLLFFMAGFTAPGDREGESRVRVTFESAVNFTVFRDLNYHFMICDMETFKAIYNGFGSAILLNYNVERDETGSLKLLLFCFDFEKNENRDPALGSYV